mgnify:CR=1 FL=1
MKAKKKLWPIAGASATGRLAVSPIRMHASAEHTHVATITAPVQTVGVLLMARLFLGERVRDRWLGLLLSLGGMALIWWNGEGWEALGDPRYIWGNLLMVLAGLGSAVQYTSQKVLSPRYSSLEILFTVFAWSTAIHLPLAWASGGLSQTYDGSTWAWALFLGLVLTAGSYFLLAEGYRRCAATTAVTITTSSIAQTRSTSRRASSSAISPSMAWMTAPSRPARPDAGVTTGSRQHVGRIRRLDQDENGRGPLIRCCSEGPGPDAAAPPDSGPATDRSPDAPLPPSCTDGTGPVSARRSQPVLAAVTCPPPLSSLRASMRAGVSAHWLRV